MTLDTLPTIHLLSPEFCCKYPKGHYNHFPKTPCGDPQRDPLKRAAKTIGNPYCLSQQNQRRKTAELCSRGEAKKLHILEPSFRMLYRDHTRHLALISPVRKGKTRSCSCTVPPRSVEQKNLRPFPTFLAPL